MTNLSNTNTPNGSDLQSELLYSENCCPGTVESDDPRERLKKALFEICKDFDEPNEAVFQLALKHGKLVTEVFDGPPWEIMSDLLDFYEGYEYTNPEDGEEMSFREWAEYFLLQDRDELCEIMFSYLENGIVSLDYLIYELRTKHPSKLKRFQIQDVNSLEEFMENFYKDSVLNVERPLFEWKEYFEHDSLGVYATCKELTEDNCRLRKQLEEIQGVKEQKQEKYYRPVSGGNPYLSIARHPGVLEEWDIEYNLAQMFLRGYPEMTGREAWEMAEIEYWENLDRVCSLAKLKEELVEIPEEELESALEELDRLTIQEWRLWELPETLWDYTPVDFDAPALKRSRSKET